MDVGLRGAVGRLSLIAVTGVGLGALVGRGLGRLPRVVVTAACAGVGVGALLVLAGDLVLDAVALT